MCTNNGMQSVFDSINLNYAACLAFQPPASTLFLILSNEKHVPWKPQHAHSAPRFHVMPKQRGPYDSMLNNHNNGTVVTSKDCAWKNGEL